MRLHARRTADNARALSRAVPFVELLQLTGRIHPRHRPRVDLPPVDLSDQLMIVMHVQAVESSQASAPPLWMQLRPEQHPLADEQD
jgi:hypothetical protein